MATPQGTTSCAGSSRARLPCFGRATPSAGSAATSSRSSCPVRANETASPSPSEFARRLRHASRSPQGWRASPQTAPTATSCTSTRIQSCTRQNTVPHHVLRPDRASCPGRRRSRLPWTPGWPCRRSTRPRSPATRRPSDRSSAGPAPSSLCSAWPRCCMTWERSPSPTGSCGSPARLRPRSTRRSSATRSRGQRSSSASRGSSRSCRGCAIHTSTSTGPATRTA